MLYPGKKSRAEDINLRQYQHLGDLLCEKKTLSLRLLSSIYLEVIAGISMCAVLEID